MYMREILNASLHEINVDIIKMGTMLEKAIDQTITALVKRDIALAETIVNGDDVFDALEQDIESKCVYLIARQQPVASDLRTIISAIKIVTDLERIADHCQDISKLTIALAHKEYVKPLVDLPKMATEVKHMIRETVDCYIEQDVLKAKKICEKDDVVDAYFKTIFKDLELVMKEKSDDIKQCMDLLMITKYLERMGDHATNVAEWVIYSVEGTQKNAL